MIASRFIDSGPDRCPKRCPIVHTSRFERSTRAEEQPHRFQLSTVGSPVKSVQTSARSSRRTNALLQQVIRDARAAEKRRTGQRFRQDPRFIAKASFFMPFDDTRSARLTGSFVKKPLQPGKATCAEPFNCVAYQG